MEGFHIAQKPGKSSIPESKEISRMRRKEIGLQYLWDQIQSSESRWKCQNEKGWAAFSQVGDLEKMWAEMICWNRL